jgi:hypothetical protein
MAKSDTRADITLNFLRNNWFSSIIIVLSTTLVGFSKVADAVDDITHYFHWGDHYDVDESTERGRFSAELLQTAEYRLFWMQAYCSSVKEMATAADQTIAWNKYQDANGKWNANLVSYFLGLDKYYPKTKKREMLEDSIQPKFHDTNELMEKIHYVAKQNASKTDSVYSIGLSRDLVQAVGNIAFIRYKFYDFIARTEREHKKRK